MDKQFSYKQASSTASNGIKAGRNLLTKNAIHSVKRRWSRLGIVTFSIALLGSATVIWFSKPNGSTNNYSTTNNHQQIDDNSQIYIIIHPTRQPLKQNTPPTEKSYLDFYNRGQEKFIAREYSQAIENYTEAIQTADNPVRIANIYNSRGISRIKLGDKQDAIRDFTQAITLDPKQTIYHRNRAAVYADLKDWSAAINNYNVAIQSNSQETELYRLRAQVHFQKGDSISALKDIRTAIHIALDKRI